MVRTLPFYLLEAGCFLADPNYIIQREYHNSYLLLYTRSGQGTLKTQGVSLSLEPGSCVILDCHKPHEYCCSGDEWEFLWFHFGGSGADTLYPLLYPAQVQQSMVENPLEFEETLRGISVWRKRMIWAAVWRLLLKSIPCCPGCSTPG